MTWAGATTTVNTEPDTVEPEQQLAFLEAADDRGYNDTNDFYEDQHGFNQTAGYGGEYDDTHDVGNHEGVYGHEPSSHGVESQESGGHEEGEHHGTHQVYAVLLPWFVQVIGIVVFYILTRKLHGLPYTAVIFILGLFMGLGAASSGYSDILSASIQMWQAIDYEVLFCVFLPGLLFKDAFETNTHLFRASILQLLCLAFPMVLAGTALTALVAMYLFPYGWSFMQCMTLGAILAATDPVAVASLLNECGAPPRLKIHISGESLLNDGSAVVFFYVFGGLFLFEQGVLGLGEDMTTNEAVVVFFKMSLGGFAVGLAFSIGLLIILYNLNRRMEHEEIVIQVAATVTIAYLCFFTSEVVLGMSGVIAVVICGLFTKAFGYGMISDWQVMSSFWGLVEHLLNTVIFALGGIVFGEILARGDLWTGTDWGYLVLLYVMVNIIRFFLMFSFYPINVRIGLSTNWQEVVFSSWGGLRGSVGITLALALDNFVYEQSTDEDTYTRSLTTKLFGHVGGIALLTLIINGTTCGPLLSALGLSDSTESRKKIVQCAEEAARSRTLDDFLHLMTDERFYFVDFALVVHHCPLLRDLTAEELKTALEQNKKSVHPAQYMAPHLEHVLPYIENSSVVKAAMVKTHVEPVATSIIEGRDSESDSFDDDNDSVGSAATPGLVKDTRIMFIELLRAAYTSQVKDGELDPREYDGFLVHALFQSLDFAQDAVSRGEPLDDWGSWMKTPKIVTKADFYARRAFRVFSSCCEKKVGPNEENHHMHLWDKDSFEYQQLRLDVLRALSFIDAHSDAQDRLKAEFSESTGAVAAAFRSVMAESRAEVEEAKEVLCSQNKKNLKHVISHYLCMILQNKTARYINSLSESGVLLQREARHFLEEIEHQIMHIRECSYDTHPGAVDFDDDQLEVIPDMRKHRANRRYRQSVMKLPPSSVTMRQSMLTPL